MAVPPLGPKERVGVIFVHGIGQQGAFEHLEHGAADLLLALKADGDGRRITASVRTTADASYRAMQETWRAEPGAPISIDIKRSDGSYTRVDLREVWWADLDEKPSLRNFLRLVWWGCSLWASRPYKDPQLDGFKNMFLPRERRLHAPTDMNAADESRLPPSSRDRVLLFFFALLFLLIVPTWALIGGLMRWLGIGTIPSARILQQYIGDVRLYGQRSRSDLRQPADLGTPPRFIIRRRFVRAMIDTATSDYDRWYVIGHSLGSVVALNGLMEPGHALPNYLDEDRWKRCGTLRSLTCKLSSHHVTDVSDMWPARPAWLEDTDAIDRKTLFEKFRGLLTYGSPLDKFAVLFPATVPLNREMYVFPKDSQWINVHEPTDPIGGSLDFFGPFRNDESDKHDWRALAPDNYAMAIWRVAFWSHITYFITFWTRSRQRISVLADTVQAWIINGRSFDVAFTAAGGRKLSVSEAWWRVFWWRTIVTILFFLVTLVLFWLVATVAIRIVRQSLPAWTSVQAIGTRILEYFATIGGESASAVGQLGVILGIGCAIVVILGALGYVFGRARP